MDISTLPLNEACGLASFASAPSFDESHFSKKLLAVCLRTVQAATTRFLLVQVFPSMDTKYSFSLLALPSLAALLSHRSSSLYSLQKHALPALMQTAISCAAVFLVQNPVFTPLAQTVSQTAKLSLLSSFLYLAFTANAYLQHREEKVRETFEKRFKLLKAELEQTIKTQEEELVPKKDHTREEINELSKQHREFQAALNRQLEETMLAFEKRLSAVYDATIAIKVTNEYESRDLYSSFNTLKKAVLGTLSTDTSLSISEDLKTGDGRQELLEKLRELKQFILTSPLERSIASLEDPSEQKKVDVLENLTGSPSAVS